MGSTQTDVGAPLGAWGSSTSPLPPVSPVSQCNKVAAGQHSELFFTSGLENTQSMKASYRRLTSLSALEAVPRPGPLPRSLDSCSSCNSLRLVFPGSSFASTSSCALAIVPLPSASQARKASR
eukprot:CAMPEP_0170572826 /NCGR_PEP_ID=MMETSP0224-20130122/2432_1 /TAXON_ID=285029 /ORGANISM="Togula jolla, Strain CCCM 725" /LENGTH=122 /DNA_ID=CAMNT_0010895359 /DNA_START=745 /DNA_END=1110 /DNA_ORIENTATION=+